MIKRMIILSFTSGGLILNRRLNRLLTAEGEECISYAPARQAVEEVRPLPGDMDGKKEMMACFWGKAGFIFIGACGIAVRYIAPHVKDKFTDSPVLVIDEKGKYVIPLLSGHVGGAVSIADRIASMIGAVPVHTTATDVRKKFAVDVFAGKNGLLITDRQAAKQLSAAVLDGERIALYLDEDVEAEGEAPPEVFVCRDPDEWSRYPYRAAVSDRMPETSGGGTALLLKPKTIIAGIGCRKGIDDASLENGLLDILKANHLEIGQVRQIASIDLKKKEHALVVLSEKYRIPFLTYPVEKLRKTGPVTSGSAFVAQVTGVDNVCERAAKLGCRDGILIQGKCIRRGMTVALVKCPVKISF